MTEPPCACHSVPWVQDGEHAGDCRLHDKATCGREPCVSRRLARLEEAERAWLRTLEKATP